MKCIAYTRPDGGVSVVFPAPADRRKGESEDEQVARATAKSVPAESLASAVVVDASALPSRRFRDCWELGGRGVRPHAGRARLQVLAEVRARRKELLDDSDRAKAKLDDVGTAEEKSKLAAYRQQLRDLPSQVAAQIQALAVAELEAYAPAFPAAPG
jgi:hypothetical protein